MSITTNNLMAHTLLIRLISIMEWKTAGSFVESAVFVLGEGWITTARRSLPSKSPCWLHLLPYQQPRRP